MAMIVRMPGVGRLQDGVGREGRGDEDHGGVGRGLLDGLGHGVEDGQALDDPASLARRHAADHLRAIFPALPRMELPGLARDSLADDPRPLIDEDAHACS